MMKLWYNGIIYTMQKEQHKVEAVITENGKIVDLGEIQWLRDRYRDLINETVDLNGSVLLPGLVDSHLHLIGVGETLLRLDLSAMNSKEEVLEAVREKASELSYGDWILGDGWNENQWQLPEVITAAELDEAAPNHPVHLKRICRHAAVVNSAALELAKIDTVTPDPEGGLIDRSPDGQLTGLLKDQAQDLMIPALPPIEEEYIQKSLREGVKHAWSLGLTGGHTEDLSYYGDFTRTYRAFQKVIEEEGHQFRAHLLVHHQVIEDWHRQGHSFLSGSRYVEFGAMKFFADGALGGRTALLKNGYADDESTNGVAIHTPDKLKQLVYKARQYDMPIAVHTIGDLAFEYMLDAIEQYPAENGQRDRLIHAQILSEELVQRVEKLPAVLDIQPRFVASDFPWVNDRIGKERMKWNYAWKTLIERGIACAGGSDAPIEPLGPLLGIHAAVTRRNPNDPSRTVYGEEECLTMYQAFELFTKGSAYVCHHEHNRGILDKGYAADFTVLEEDPFACDPDKLLTMKVMLTVVDGKTVYQA
ncbi:amidohydrolase [Jeotgalibacillus proteolyticus]|uniref:Amidohydrolase n=1 Tax=Jeotgalibacillus proteolyticus TaxID=2082395 RepID=A0A2S5GF30_9BACL|nr:amidohydrolase [Jeotgalibacillus proteolyticus]PPA71647.1 amidohydrolase [Jeotgalibacillus proteolyticus]